MIHLYALTGRDLPVPGVEGIDRAPVRDLPCGDLHAVVSEHPQAPAASRDAALRHAEVVAAVAAQTPTLPVRFGTDHGDVEALRASIAGAAGVLRGSLDRVGGCVEFVTRLARPPAPPTTPTPATATATASPSGGPGTAYLEARLAEQQAIRSAEADAADRLRQATAPLDQLAAEVRAHRGPAGVERCYLVPGREAEQFAATARAVATGADVVVGGPWPPYTFAQGPS